MTALLREGLRELGLDESRAETLERFAALLLKKNEVMNLTAITEPEAVAHAKRRLSIFHFPYFSSAVFAGVSFRYIQASTDEVLRFRRSFRLQA